MQKMSFESTPSSSSEAAVAMATGMAMRSAPGGAEPKITNVEVRESNGVWIAVVMVELEEELEPEMEEDEESGDKAGDTHVHEHDVAESYYYLMHSYHSTDAPSFPETLDDDAADAISHPVAGLDEESHDFEQHAHEHKHEHHEDLLGPDTLTSDADLMADQLITDFNEPAPANIPHAETLEERLDREREEELRRIEVGNNLPPPLT